ncbi:MAG: hypothetical protein ACFCBW_05595 [Candidatus Competibacterales bacterium]
MGALFWRLEKPVNYEAMAIFEGHFEYKALGETHIIPWREVSYLDFVREEALFPDPWVGYYPETQWLFRLCDGRCRVVMDERPHRRQLLKAFQRQWPAFDLGAARAGLQSRRLGRWRCYTARSTLSENDT